MDWLSTIWQRLADAVSNRSDPMRHVVLCTAGGHGRVVVLREVDNKALALHIYSDARASKVEQVGNAEIVAYDHESQLQVRARGTLVASKTGSGVDGAWDGLGPHSRENYRGYLAPGCQVPTIADCARLADQDGRANFARLTLQVGHWDVLWLREKRRAQARMLQPNGVWERRWVQM